MPRYSKIGVGGFGTCSATNTGDLVAPQLRLRKDLLRCISWVQSTEHSKHHCACGVFVHQTLQQVKTCIPASRLSQQEKKISKFNSDNRTGPWYNSIDLSNDARINKYLKQLRVGGRGNGLWLRLAWETMCCLPSLEEVFSFPRSNHELKGFVFATIDH
jgi:hypothetical protein